jgi:hypothetical protein
LQIAEQLKRLPPQAHDLEFVPIRNEPLVKENKGAEAGAIDELHLREIKDDIFVSLGETLNVRPHAGDVGRIEIVVNFMLLRHKRTRIAKVSTA